MAMAGAYEYGPLVLGGLGLYLVALLGIGW
jgi:hypothetical protein